MSGNGSLTCDHVTFKAREALTASHSFGATTPMKFALRTTLTPAMPAMLDSSTATTDAPATGGRIMRPCSMPATRTSLTQGLVANTLPSTSKRFGEVPTILYWSGVFTLAGEVNANGLPYWLFQPICEWK